MWVEQLPNGKFKFRERCENPMTGKEIKVSITLEKNTAATRKLAQSALNDKIEQKLKKLSSPDANAALTLSDLVSLYQSYQKTTVSLSTFRRNSYAAKSLMEILGSGTLVERLTAGYVRDRLYSADHDPVTINERITRFKALIRWGYQNDYIEDIRWLDKIKKQKNGKKFQKLEDKFLESDDLKLLLSQMTVEKWRLLTEFTALSGLRVGEAIGLLSSDVDFDNRYIYVRRTFDPVNQVVTSPKTAASNRDVYMQDELLLLCKKIKLLTNKERILCGFRTNLFFCDLNGGHLEYYAYNKYLKEKADRILGKKVTTHFMRHTHVALMAEQGVPLDIISRRLGHADSKVTRDIYFHVTEKLKERDNQRIRDIKIL